MADKQAHAASPALYDIIRQIAHHGVIDSQTGAVIGTERTIGYVAKINTEGDLAGTVDVQEYMDEVTDDDREAKVGYHEGVYISALQNNNGMLIRPRLYSDVVIVYDPASQREYVTMVSHVELIQLDAHDKVTIGVKERKEFDLDDDDGDDIDELEETGVATYTEYTKNNISDYVVGDEDGKKTVTQTLNGESGYSVDVQGKGSITSTGDATEIAQGNSKVNVTDGVVYVGDTQNTDNAVLGQQLASILSDLMGYLGQMMTPTMMGPQAPANVLANFIALKAKIQTFASAQNGFLTQKVLIQK